MRSGRFVEDQILFLCCRQDFTEEMATQVVSIVREEPVDWQTFFDLAHNHGVAPLIFHNLQAAIAQGLNVPHDVVGRFKLATYRNITIKTGQRQTLANALASLQRFSVDVMTVKGMALDLLVYEERWYTFAQDTDIILRPREEGVSTQDRAAIVECLEGRGIEYEFNEHHDVNLNRALDVDFEQIWRDAMMAELSGHSLYLMSIEDMLLSTCINSCRKRYFRLRSLCDIAETIKKYPDLDWPVFVRKAKAYRCHHIAYTALAVTQQTVGCPMPEGLLGELGLSGPKRRVVDRLIPYLLHNVSLASLSYYTGQEFVGRKVGWSLLLPYATYQGNQMSSKIREALTAYMAKSEEAA